MNEKINLTDLDVKIPATNIPPVQKESRLVVYLLVSIIVLLVAIILVIVLIPKEPVLTPPEPNPTAFPTNSVPTIVPSPSPTNDQITWRKTPLKISSIPAIVPFNSSSNGLQYQLDKARYFETATLPDGSKLVNVFLPTEGMGIFEALYRFIVSKDNKISFIDRDNQWQYNKDIFAKDVTLSSFSIRELDPPESLTIGINNFKRGYLQEGTFDKFTNPKLVKETEFGEIYVVYSPYKQNQDLSGRMFYLKLKDSTFYYYDLRIPFMGDDRVPNIQWSDNSNLKSQFQDKLIRGGCGQSVNPGPDVIKDGSSLLTPKEIVAVWGDKQLYQVKDPANFIVKTAYDSYKVGRDYPSAPPILSYDAFLQTKNHLLFQDSFGDWQFLLNQDYSMQAECGKPVIYLYPTKDTEVSVKVGANITVSEPLYPSSGWKVLAHSDGHLDYLGQSYPNLFWEGTGYGIYPDKSNYGTVVSQSKLISTLTSQLMKLGLNTQESADFMEFWTDKLPTTPYVRLTWLDTKDMNTLAPLQVYPQPKTTIRIFLEFEGLEKSVKLIPQDLSAPKRVGFTLVEWGGLLRK